MDDTMISVGIPLVKDALAVYNTSLLAYGQYLHLANCYQTGSGKTYTLWGPPSAMVETPSTNGLQGIVPCIFEMLFDNIQREHENSEDKKISYQCRCSFLEVNYLDTLGHSCC
ncbi:PREDICTED: kinesin-like protein KIN-12F isoform X2 [Ipomoea nil]|uniref:kinesin-like protein KIN-12F isoform X2 n=1 Tax=Ipomoea nil TaxID=35883 RepID=UPI000901F46E|nr:PREDICTED: kinesin-like protein KIN-12F isoform X2 [Ipomoea nil]